MHVALLGACAWFFRSPITATLVAAGDGEGSGESVIEVGTVDARALGLPLFRTVSSAGDEPNKANNMEVDTTAPPPDPNADVLPSTNPTPLPKDIVTTDRPTVKTPQLVSPEPLRGGAANRAVDVGPSMGTLNAGVGFASGADLGGGDIGVPGGSAYGRIIQGILARNYNPSITIDASAVQYVIVDLRIARDGRILSVVNGRVAPNSFKKRSPNALLNNAVERAILASNPLPPFPNGFLMGAQEAIAPIMFKYPK